MSDWQVNVARHFAEASQAITKGNVSNAKVALGTALAYLLRAAGDGDDGAFALLASVREAIDEAEPTMRLTWEPEK